MADVYLVEHPPATQQYRCPRRERPSGVIGVHTAESFPDDDPPDDGAENVARFISRRSTYGSYHWLADSDSIIQLIEHRCVAYHIATHGLNEHTIGISAATQAHKWDNLSSRWVDATVRNMARAAADAARWLEREHGITVPARRITLSQALDRQPGFIAHADADPDRRTDPGRAFPWGTFLDYFAAEMGATLAWNEDLSPGTPGNDITPLADETLPKSYGRDAADLLGYAAATFPFVRLGGLFRELWFRDGEIAAPESYPGKDTNPHWHPRRFLQEMVESAKYHIQPDVARTRELVEAIADSQLGADAEEIKAHIDQRYAEAAQQREALAEKLDGAAAEREQIRNLVEQGQGDPAAALREIARLIGEEYGAADDG